MKKILIRKIGCFTVVAITLGLGGCAHLGGCLKPPEPPKICRELEVADSIDPQEACPSWRRVALKTHPEGPCPDPGAVAEEREGTVYEEKWTIEHLFAAGAPDVDPASAEAAAALPPALRPFCLYEYKKNAPLTLEQLNAKLDSLIGKGRPPKAFERIDSGCAAVGPAAGKDSRPDSPWQDLETFFLEQVGAVEPVTVLGPRRLERGHEPRVRLSFLDTQPDKADQGANSQHGYALSQIAHKIACDEAPEIAGRCTAEIDYRLALPIESFDRDDPEKTRIDRVLGGYSGSVDFLAAAVWDALRNHALSPRQHLVLNLSLAWDGKIFGGLEKTVAMMPVTVQALYRALEVASCRGALVVAAAGNRGGGPGAEDGPLLPGGWERRDAPTIAACRAILGLEAQARHPPDPPRVSREPLVYAAGGVRFDNSPLYNARPGATPPRVAYASQALVEGSSKPLTGTSVATAVIATTAAVVWHHWPYLTRAELMDLLYRAGDPVARPADFYHPSSGLRPEARRVALCPALARACAELGGMCPGECQQRSTEKPVWSWDGASCSKTIDAGKIRKQMASPVFCGNKTILYDPDVGIPVDPCPARQFYGATAMSWRGSTLPQPEDDPCMGCGPGGGESRGLVGVSVGDFESIAASKARSLRIEIDPAWEKPLSQAFLEIGDYSLALGVGRLKGGDCVLVENLDVDKLAGMESNPYVILRFRTEDQRVTSVPLPF